MNARLLVRMQIHNFLFALNSVIQCLNVDTRVKISANLARKATTHANRNARGRCFVAIFVEESAMEVIPAHPAIRNVRYHVCIQNVLVNAAISVHHVLRTVTGSAFTRESVVLCVEPHVTDCLVISDATNCLPAVIAVLVSVAKIAQMFRFASNAAPPRLRRTLSTCLSSIHTKNKTWIMIRSSSYSVGTFIQPPLWTELWKSTKAMKSTKRGISLGCKYYPRH
mmetsp:Transcript_28631/g.48675  ORF Transcript_28631/g.48675 Transcript_28631/m.48675 type:complete len:224 (+) Transcript_28631:724-1395(+)